MEQGRAEIWLVDLDASGTALDGLALELDLLPSEDVARYQALTDESERLRRRRVRAALRLLLATHIGLETARRPFAISSAGKPRIAGQSSHAFSVAHSGTRALVAIARSAEIGVDLEVRTDIAMDERRRLALEASAAALAPGVPLPSSGPRRLLQAWTRLEAVAKATGMGIGPLLTDLGVHGPADGLAAADRDAARRLLGEGPTSLRVADLALGLAGIGAVALGHDVDFTLCDLPASPADDSGIRRLAAASG